MRHVFALLVGISSGFLASAEEAKTQSSPHSKTKSASRENNQNGFKILSVETGSIYESLGLQKGDLITSINGKHLTNLKDFENVLRELEDDAEVTLIRAGQEKTLKYHLK